MSNFKREREYFDDNPYRNVEAKLEENILQNFHESNSIMFSNAATSVEEEDRRRIFMQQAAIESIVDAGNDFFKVIQVTKDASLDVISSSYKTLSKLVHPDKCNLANAILATQKLNEAYEWLKNPDKQSSYDSKSDCDDSSLFYSDDDCISINSFSNDDESIRNQENGELNGESQSVTDKDRDQPVTDKDRVEQLGFAPEIAEVLGVNWKDKFCYCSRWFRLSDGEPISETKMELEIYEYLKINSNISLISQNTVSLKKKIIRLAQSTLKYLKEFLPRPSSASLKTEVDEFIIWFNTNFIRTFPDDNGSRISVHHLSTGFNVSHSTVHNGMKLIAEQIRQSNQYYRQERIPGTNSKGIYKGWKSRDEN